MLSSCMKFEPQGGSLKRISVEMIKRCWWLESGIAEECQNEPGDKKLGRQDKDATGRLEIAC